MHTQTESTTSTPQEVVENYFARIDRRDEAAFDLVAEDFINHASALQGRAGHREIVHILDHDLDGPEIRRHHVVASGDLVVVHVDLIGTHVASSPNFALLADVPPTGKPVVWTFMHLFRVSGGMIAEHWACRDDLGLLVQLGAFPAPTQ
ncbi:ester cyclase [Lapillicoccus sp.]|uniref:ester cyclase n=1 Tax=Lapillicoccus sp. TaxID=1909287 RepID=UPI003266D108